MVILSHQFPHPVMRMSGSLAEMTMYIYLENEGEVEQERGHRNGAQVVHVSHERERQGYKYCQQYKDTSTEETGRLPQENTTVFTIFSDLISIWYVC